MNKLGWLNLLFILSLVACSSTKEDDLNRYIQEVKMRKAHPIKALPTFLAPIKFIYPENDNRRDPFKQKEVLIASEQFTPDIKRPKQRLEQFPLDALKFVGILKQGPTIWALINLPTGEIVRVKSGDYMGKNFGRVIRITDTALVLEEVIRAAGKWQKKQTIFNLNGPQNDMAPPTKP